MGAKIIVLGALCSVILFPEVLLSKQGIAVIVDGVNDFGDDYLLAIDTLDPPPYADDSLYRATGIGDASIYDNWNFWVGPDTNLLANPVEMGRLFVSNDMFYLYIGLDHTDTDGLPAPGGGFGYWNTQIGVAIDVDSTPTGGNEASWSPSGFTDPWSNNQIFLHSHRPDYVAWFDHHSNDFKLYRWNPDGEEWIEITQDSIDLYHEEFGFRPGYILLRGEDGVSHKEPGDPGPYSGADRFVEFQIPLRAIGIDYGAIAWDSLRTVPSESLPPVVSVQAWCTQPGRGAYDVVPSDDQICRYPSMGDWGGVARTTKLQNYADYILLPYPDQIPPEIRFEELPTSEVLITSAKGLKRLSVIAAITDRFEPTRSNVANVKDARVYYSSTATIEVDTIVDTITVDTTIIFDTTYIPIGPFESMVNIEGTDLWIADIPDTVFFLIWAEDIGGPNITVVPPPSTGPFIYNLYSPPENRSAVRWSRPVEVETTATIFIPDGTLLDIFPGGLTADSITLSIPDSTTFLEPLSYTFSPPYATNGEITPLGVFRKVEAKGRRVLDKPARLMFHYTDEQVDGLNEDILRIYYWNEESERWTRCGGHPDPEANVVTAEIVDLGIYGLFEDPNVSREITQVIDDVNLDPNPFSPNKDGLYDNLSIQFSLNTDALVSISIYNIEGKLIRTLIGSERFLKGVHNKIWDGCDEDGNYVPYGFYFVLIYAKSTTAELPLAKITKGVGVIR